MGGVDHEGTLVRGTPEAVGEEVRAAIAGTGGAGLILAPGCSVPPEAPAANLRAFAASAGAALSPQRLRPGTGRR